VTLAWSAGGFKKKPNAPPIYGIVLVSRSVFPTERALAGSV
jgi:hypothetical protein